MDIEDWYHLDYFYSSKCSKEYSMLDGIGKYCELLNEKKFAGYDDWRLPSGEEAKSVFSFTQSNADKDGAETHISDLFESGGGHNTWTYEEKPDYQQYAQKFSFITGNDMWEHKDNEYSHCRVTRDVIQDDWEPEWRKETKTFER